MTASTTKPNARDRLRGWLDRHDRWLAERAVSDIDETDTLRGPVKHGDVTSTQLQGLLNTAKMTPIDTAEESDNDLTTYVRKRKERRASADQDDAEFWEELESVLGGFDDIVDKAVEACGAEETTPQSVRAGRLDRRAVHTQVVRRYMTHFVAHCQYLQTLD